MAHPALVALAIAMGMNNSVMDLPMASEAAHPKRTSARLFQSVTRPLASTVTIASNAESKISLRRSPCSACPGTLFDSPLAVISVIYPLVEHGMSEALRVVVWVRFSGADTPQRDERFKRRQPLPSERSTPPQARPGRLGAIAERSFRTGRADGALTSRRMFAS